MNTESSIELVAKTVGISQEYLKQSLQGLDNMMSICHQLAVKGGWWTDLETGERKERNRGEMLMLIVSEVSEAMEGERKNLKDDHLPLRGMAEVELADVLIRLGDYAKGFDHKVVDSMIEKMAYNLCRPDHKPENRLVRGGKKF